MCECVHVECVPFNSLNILDDLLMGGERVREREKKEEEEKENEKEVGEERGEK